MATMTSYAHGQFCWIDLMAHDMSTAKQFYGGLFGWQAEDQDTQGGPPYAIYKADGQGLCGMGQMSDEMKASGMPPVWNSYVNVDDVDAAISKAEGLGATITMPPMQVGEAGKMAIIQDPAGAFVSFWEKINHFGAQQVNAPNTWGWNELLCNDPDIAIKFYSELFGWTFDKEPNSPNDYWIFKNGDRMNGGLMQITPEMQGVPPNWSVYFSVADLQSATDTVKQLGGNVLAGPFEVSVGRIAVVADAQGAAFQLIQLTVPVDE